MPSPLTLSKADVRRALVRHHFAPAVDQMDAFHRLRSIQFDPIAPVGCNHDLVLQARVRGYKVGEWQQPTYDERLVYDGWDKQASLVPFTGWPLRRILHVWHKARMGRVFDSHPQAIQAVLKELEQRGPLLPKEFRFQERKDEWKDSWHGPSLTKQALRALWHAGMVMTAGRRKGHHIYDLTERVVPPEIYAEPMLSEDDSRRELVLDRHRALGVLRPTASYEVWSYMYAPERKMALAELLDRREIVPVDIEGVQAHATPEFLALLDLPSIDPRVVFVAPLDQLVWDRKLVEHLFGFDYVWEIYTPVPKRKWGYYVLPVLYGDDLVARVEFACRSGILEMRQWHYESQAPKKAFTGELKRSLYDFMNYCSATAVQVQPHIDPKIRDLAESI